MTLAPLWTASWAVQVHLLTLVMALLVGSWQTFISRKASPTHRRLGVVFISLMIATALVTLLIHERAPHSAFFGLSLLHLYVPLILVLCTLAWYGAVARQRRLHRFAVVSLYFGSLLFTGLVQVLLTRGISHEIFFGR